MHGSDKFFPLILPSSGWTKVVRSTALVGFHFLLNDAPQIPWIYSFLVSSKLTHTEISFHACKRDAINKCQENCPLSSFLLYFHCGSFNSLQQLTLNLTYVYVIWKSKDIQWDLSATGWEDTLNSCQSEKMLLRKLQKYYAAVKWKKKHFW